MQSSTPFRLASLDQRLTKRVCSKLTARPQLGNTHYQRPYRPCAFFWTQRPQKQSKSEPKIKEAPDIPADEVPRNLDVQLPLPVQYYQLLGLQGKTPMKSSDILVAYEDLCTSPVPSGYSRAVQHGKTVVLERARSLFVNAKDKMAAFAASVTVEVALVPAVLAVLQEVGENELVVRIGGAVLAQLDAFSFQKDIKLAMALAQFTLAQEAVDSKTETREAYQRLQEALELIQQGSDQPSLAPELEDRIVTGLEQLTPFKLLETLRVSSKKGSSSSTSSSSSSSGPKVSTTNGSTSNGGSSTSDNGSPSDSSTNGSTNSSTNETEFVVTDEQRAEAMMELKELLLSAAVVVDSPRDDAEPQDGDQQDTSPITRDYVMSALQTMTAKEIVALVNWALVARNPEQFPWCTTDILRVAALSHIVAGAAYQDINALNAAQDLLNTMQKSCDVFVERVVCELLMGHLGSAQKLIKSEEQKRKKVAGYLPAATTRLALPPPPPPKSTRRKDTSGDFAPNVLPKRDDIIPFIRYHSPDDKDTVLEGLCLFTELWLKQVALPQFPDTSNPATLDSIAQRLHNLAATRHPELVSQLSLLIQIPLIPFRALQAGVVRLCQHVMAACAPLLSGLGNTAGSTQKELMSDLAGFGRSFRQSLSTVVLGVVVVVAALYSGDALEARYAAGNAAANRMAGAAQRQYYDAGPRTGTLATHVSSHVTPATQVPPATPVPSRVTPVMTRASSQAASTTPVPTHVTPSTTQVPPVVSTPVDQATSSQRNTAVVDRATAEKVLRRWQAAKAAAFGAQHDTSSLRSIVMDPLLSSLQQQCSHTANTGWFFDYAKQAVTVNSIGPMGPGESNVKVVATVREKCDLKSVDGQQAGGYADKYQVEYSLAQGADGSWKISQVKLL